MTTPPQGPWGPGQPGGQPGGQRGRQGGQGGWGQQPPGQGGGWGQRPPQPQRPPYQGQPPQQGRPPQQGGGWGQPPHQGGGYQQQPWLQQNQPGGGWYQQQGGQPPWQPGGPGSSGSGGPIKDKLPLLIGGGVIGIVVIGLLIFLGVRAFGGDDKPEANPTTGQSQQPSPNQTTGDGGDSGSLGNASGQAKTATDKLRGIGYQCSDLFNTGQGAHRGCFKYDGATEAEAIFQFQPDGTIIGVLLKSLNEDNVNNAGVTFDAELQAIGNGTFGGSEVKKIQDAVKTGQKSQKVGSSWGEFQLRNDGDELRLTGGKSGSDSFDLPRKTFETTEAQLVNALRAKRYTCTSSCSKQVGKYGTQRVYSYASEGEGVKTVEISASGDPSDVKTALPAAVSDAFAALKGADVSALKSYVETHKDGKSYAAYVAGWRVEITGTIHDDYASQRISISYESFYV